MDRKTKGICPYLKLFPKQQILDSSKLKEFADDNFKFGENGRTFSKWVENTDISHIVFKRLVLQTRINQDLFGKGLKPGQTTAANDFKTTISPITRRQILDSSKLKEFADDNFRFDENGKKLSKRVEKNCGKKRNCSLRAISPFPTVFSKGLFPRGVKRCHCVGMG